MLKDEPEKLTFKATGTLEGTQVKDMTPEMLANPPELSVERIDGTTVALNSPGAEGRMVYKHRLDELSSVRRTVSCL